MKTKLQQAFLGSLIADAVAMPVHWYYDVNALDRDFPEFTTYHAPKQSHPDSILWRSRYQARNEDADILHDQAQYWGQRGIHYHQFLKAGENTVNFRLASALYDQVVTQGGYDLAAWAETYVRLMRTPGWHGDTYVEEYHRGFFDQRARGVPLLDCGINDIHIGGLATVPALVAALATCGLTTLEEMLPIIRDHVALTHRNPEVRTAAEGLAGLLLDIASGEAWSDALKAHAARWASPAKLDTWTAFADRQVVGKHLSTACYLPESFTAALYLAYKHRESFTAGILSNARCGGDNCHRGAVVGALLGAVEPIPERWLSGLRHVPPSLASAAGASGQS